jgi:hypothetical protein
MEEQKLTEEQLEEAIQQEELRFHRELEECKSKWGSAQALVIDKHVQRTRKLYSRRMEVSKDA